MSEQRHRLFAFMTVLAVMWTCWATSTAMAAPPVISATLDPQQIVLGESAKLTITTSGSDMPQFNMPQVDGLEFGVLGQSHSIQIMNGAMLSSSSIVIRVTPRSAGIFTIPGITPQSQPLILRVSPDNGSGATGTPHAAVPNALLGAPNAEGIRMAADGAAFVRLVLPKRDVYVGESVPVEIEVGARDGFARPNGLPTLTSSEFTLNNLTRNPENAQRVIDGKPYTVFTWRSEIAAVKPGKFTLSLDVPFTVRMRTRPSRDTAIEDMLGDPFLQNIFGATVQRDITVSSPTSDLSVLSLPTEDQPKDFTGAVGSFNITSDLSATTAAAGDPLTLRMHVTGAGNFDRVDSPMLEHIDGWKTYPPKSAFKGTDNSTYKGEKTFEQPVIASRPGTQTLPALSFSYFNPTTKHYETARSAALQVSITPSLADSSLSAPQAPAAASEANKAPANPAPVGLRPDHAADAGTVGTLVPLYAQPRFLAAPVLFALSFVGVWLALRRAAAPRKRSQSANTKAVNRILQDMQAASRARDTTLFFNIARQALRQSLATRWKLAPEDISNDEIDARLGAEGAEIREILALADEVNYSGHEMSSTDFQRWMHIVRDRLLESTQT
jgi:oxygen tolerance protein BatD